MNCKIYELRFCLFLNCCLRGGQTILSISHLQSQCKVLAPLFRLILPILLILSMIVAHQYNPVLRASKTEKRWRVLRVTRIFVFILSGATIESKSETNIELQLKTRIHDVHFVLSALLPLLSPQNGTRVKTGFHSSDCPFSLE